ncbi:hypothetical protein FQR65_LT00632 [Abscondita terminalis]|nr:hypothetical protein FQR65_LT00632 [Abscondita terminalis]
MWLIIPILFTVNAIAGYDTKMLLPDISNCGQQHTSNDSYVSIYDFPWMVHVKLSNFDGEYEFADRCSGVLINDQYVLTSAYCGSEAIKVVLGQYKTNESISCQGLECTKPIKSIKVEEYIRDGKTENGLYDFGLLRLQEKLTFSDFIKPICLNTNGSEYNKNLTISGWGSSNSGGVEKKRLKYNVNLSEVCYGQESLLKENIKLANVSFICALPDENNSKSACNGERGGPFMYKSDSNQWFVDGVVIEAFYEIDFANHLNTCSHKKPVTGIRITKNVIDWILTTIRP